MKEAVKLRKAPHKNLKMVVEQFFIKIIVLLIILAVKYNLKAYLRNSTMNCWRQLVYS